VIVCDCINIDIGEGFEEIASITEMDGKKVCMCWASDRQIFVYIMSLVMARLNTIEAGKQLTVKHGHVDWDVELETIKDEIYGLDQLMAMVKDTLDRIWPEDVFGKSLDAGAVIVRKLREVVREWEKL